MTRVHAVSDSPVGTLTLIAEDGALVGVFMDAQAHRPADTRFGEPTEADPHGTPEQRLLAEAQQQLAEYFAGTRREFDLPLRAAGTAFQQRVWAGLREIPYGQTWSYGRLAEHVGQPGAARAVGLANGRNPLGIVVPCHRVIGASGALVGYGGGMDRKKALLALEGALPAPSRRAPTVPSPVSSEGSGQAAATLW